MIDREKYRYDDFTVSQYVKYLEAASTNYKFTSFVDALTSDRFLLNRHDIDFCMSHALRLAKEEHALGLKSTYFLHLHSENYNLLDKANSDMVYGILKLGHYIGVHFDSHYYDIDDESQLEDALGREHLLIERVFNVKCEVFSFHNTNKFTMGCKKLRYSGLLNAYATEFMDDMKYCSDSNGYWRFDRLFDLINSEVNPKMHVLTHPVWWQDNVKSPWQKIENTIMNRAAKNLELYNEYLRKFNMKNIGND